MHRSTPCITPLGLEWDDKFLYNAEQMLPVRTQAPDESSEFSHICPVFQSFPPFLGSFPLKVVPGCREQLGAHLFRQKRLFSTIRCSWYCWALNEWFWDVTNHYHQPTNECIRDELGNVNPRVKLPDILLDQFHALHTCCPQSNFHASFGTHLAEYITWFVGVTWGVTRHFS